ncbi:MAG: FAD-binding and (Fe-S)-binding domain-containing protein [Bacteroidota bacterium]
MIATDELTRRLYANDASMYEELPQGVAFPKSAEDIQALIQRAQQEGTSITARTAGTSLAGQATGGGWIMDVSRYLNQQLEIEPQAQTARVEPGVIRDTLNRKAAQYDLEFGPDTSTTNRCMLGGMIGNNSAGSFSIKHGSTRDHIIEIDVVLSDGSLATFKPLTEAELDEKLKLHSLEGHIYRGMMRIIQKHRDLILESYPHPEIIRRNTGYALDRLCTMQPFDPQGRKFNLAELLCGSEGTLAMTTSAQVRLVPIDPHKVLYIPQFHSLNAAMRATVEAVKYDPAAVELVDDVILDATKGNIEHRQNRFFLEDDPSHILIIQFEGQDPEETLARARQLQQTLQEKQLGYAHPILTDDEKMTRVWNLRKAGLGLLMGLGKDSRSPTFTEDTAVRVQDLPEYVQRFQQLLDKYDTHCVFYAHASVGELHLRPMLDLSKPEGLRKMKAMAADIADLVSEFRGSLSGEHGDGRARAPYIEKVLGAEMMPVLRQVKELWDPNYIFNPGKIINPEPIDEDLRFSPEYQRPEVDTSFAWHESGSFADALELCNGAGVCRKRADSGGTMCPSYMATLEEKDVTRGRANVFRQVFSAQQHEGFNSEVLKEALDLCLSCKACKSECPANVDMAKMKAEFTHGWHQRNGISLRERFFGEAGSLYPLASRFPRLSNWMLRQKPVQELLDQVLGIHKERQLPIFAVQSFHKKWPELSSQQRNDTGDQQERDSVALFVDLFTNYHQPQIAEAACRILWKLGYKVQLLPIRESGRPQLSKGMLGGVQQLADQNIPLLIDTVERGTPIIGLEPSELLTFRDEYLDLCTEEQLPRLEKAVSEIYLLEEFLADHTDALSELAKPPEMTKHHVQLHGHCHAKALVGTQTTIAALEAVGYQVEDLDSGCCGMAGSFGYQKEHYELSMQIGNQRLFPALTQKQESTQICAPGFSCRHQINDGTGLTAQHPAELIAQHLDLQS